MGPWQFNLQIHAYSSTRNNPFESELIWKHFKAIGEENDHRASREAEDYRASKAGPRAHPVWGRDGHAAEVTALRPEGLPEVITLRPEWLTEADQRVPELLNPFEALFWSARNLNL